MDKKKERVQSGLPKGRSTSNNRNGNGVSGVQSNGQKTLLNQSLADKGMSGGNYQSMPNVGLSQTNTQMSMKQQFKQNESGVLAFINSAGSNGDTNNTKLSQYSPDIRSPNAMLTGADGLPIKDTLSLDDVTHNSVGFQDDPLVKFGVDMTQLSDYLDNII